jgi:hypothetical protein
MAFSRTVSTAWGITVVDSYCRVEGVTLASKNTLQFWVRSYAASSDVPFFSEKAVFCSYDIDGPNPIKQAYEHLKTLPEFADAIDC